MADNKTPDGGGDRKNFDFKKSMRMPWLNDKFAAMSKYIFRDLNNPQGADTPTFKRYTKDEINTYIADPYRYEQQLRDAVIYIYGASSHFRRLIQYFVSLTDLSYVVSPTGIDPLNTNPRTISLNYRRTLNALTAMSIRTQFPKILTICLREDVYYGTMWVTESSILFQQLPSKYCRISSIEGNVFNVSFDFTYFESRQNMLPLYPEEFTVKYNAYTKDRLHLRWQELDAPNSFAIKVNNDIVDYAVPPFVGILREVYEIEDYKNLKLTKTALENYAILFMTDPMTDEGDYLIPLDVAREFWQNLDSVLPEEVGSVLTPMEVNKVGFEKSNTGDTDNVAEAAENLFTTAGVSSLLFNNDKASANALLLSIKADQAMTFGIVKSIEDVLNRFISAQGYGKKFKVTFLDCSPFNRKEMGDQYIKACQYGLPMVSYYCASQGLGQAELDCMNFLENDVLELKTHLIPLSSSSTLSSTVSADSEAPTDEGGAPVKDIGEVSDQREANSEAE